MKAPVGGQIKGVTPQGRNCCSFFFFFLLTIPTSLSPCRSPVSHYLLNVFFDKCFWHVLLLETLLSLPLTTFFILVKFISFMAFLVYSQDGYSVPPSSVISSFIICLYSSALIIVQSFIPHSQQCFFQRSSSHFLTWKISFFFKL